MQKKSEYVFLSVKLLRQSYCGCECEYDLYVHAVWWINHEWKSAELVSITPLLLQVCSFVHLRHNCNSKRLRLRWCWMFSWTVCMYHIFTRFEERADSNLAFVSNWFYSTLCIFYRQFSNWTGWCNTRPIQHKIYCIPSLDPSSSSNSCYHLSSRFIYWYTCRSTWSSLKLKDTFLFIHLS